MNLKKDGGPGRVEALASTPATNAFIKCAGWNGPPWTAINDVNGVSGRT